MSLRPTERSHGCPDGSTAMNRTTPSRARAGQRFGQRDGDQRHHGESDPQRVPATRPRGCPRKRRLQTPAALDACDEGKQR